MRGPEIIESGVWCPACLLPSAVVALYELDVGAETEIGFVRYGALTAHVRWCSDCGLTEVTKS